LNPAKKIKPLDERGLARYKCYEKYPCGIFIIEF
jgi:hypothetical protein